jgi:hypothetical protein
MPTNRTRRTRKAGGVLDAYQKDDLLHGHFLIPGRGYCDPSKPDGRDMERMRVDWQRHKAELMAEWTAENPGTRPYAWRQFEAQE